MFRKRLSYISLPAFQCLDLLIWDDLLTVSTIEMQTHTLIFFGCGVRALSEESLDYHLKSDHGKTV